MDRLGVLFVCLGNICRSPLAEGVFRHRVDLAGLGDGFHIDSCGTSSYHVGDAPDPGSVRVARARGVDISGQRSRQLRADDAERFRYLICMDASNARNTRACVGGYDARIFTLREWDPEGPGGVPDPWGGGIDAFERVFSIVDRSCEALLAHIKKEHSL